MLTYTLETNRKRTLTKQLYEGIKGDILSGKLRQGERLPSKRRLAEHLNISIITVENAYQQLMAEGYLCARQRSGYYVNPIEVKRTSEVPRKKKERGFEEPVSESKDLIDLRTNQICEENFPCATLSRIMRQVLSEKRGMFQPLECCGIKELRQAISDHLYRYREISVSPEQIVVGAGTEYLYHLLIQLLGRDAVYALETPGYSKISRIYDLNGVPYEYVPLDKSGMSVEKLEETKADIIHISPSHHFPTGIVMPIGRRQELLRWADKKDERYIIEDDYDSEFRFAGRPIEPIYNLEPDKVIYINTFSKSITPAVRISYMILPEKLMEKYRRRMSFYSCTVSGIDQHMMAKFIGEGYFERHINRMKTLYRAKRDAVINAIRLSAFAKRVTIMEEDAGLHFLMKINTKLSDEEIKRLAEDAGIKVAFLSDYTQAKDITHSRHIMVINYSGIQEDKIPLAVERLEKVLVSEIE